MSRAPGSTHGHICRSISPNFFRLAAIMQGIAGRVRDGTATSAFAAAKGELVRPLAAKGFEFMREAA